MRRQLDVVVGDLVHRHLRNGSGIDQVPDGNQRAGYEERVVWRQPQIAMRDLTGERSGADADRPDRLRLRMPRAVHRARADPYDVRR